MYINKEEFKSKLERHFHGIMIADNPNDKLSYIEGLRQYIVSYYEELKGQSVNEYNITKRR